MEMSIFRSTLLARCVTGVTQKLYFYCNNENYIQPYKLNFYGIRVV